MTPVCVHLAVVHFTEIFRFSGFLLLHSCLGKSGLGWLGVHWIQKKCLSAILLGNTTFIWKSSLIPVKKKKEEQSLQMWRLWRKWHRHLLSPLQSVTDTGHSVSLCSHAPRPNAASQGGELSVCVYQCVCVFLCVYVSPDLIFCSLGRSGIRKDRKDWCADK